MQRTVAPGDHSHWMSGCGSCPPPTRLVLLTVASSERQFKQTLDAPLPCVRYLTSLRSLSLFIRDSVNSIIEDALGLTVQLSWASVVILDQQFALSEGCDHFMKSNCTATVCIYFICTYAYQSLVLPIMEYGSVCWDSYRLTQRRFLERIQRRAAKFVRMKSKLGHEVFRELGWDEEQQAWIDIARNIEKPTYYRKRDTFKIKRRKQRTDVGQFSFLNKTMNE
ncbi:hypothetical protein C0J52_27544 [Blattella germanica]|nr:hypothetical protein C0J52_27544 [Blattella germanica]